MSKLPVLPLLAVLPVPPGLLVLAGLLIVLAVPSLVGAQIKAPGSADSGPDGGHELFLQHCSRCHGVEGGGGEGPALTRPRLKRAETDADLGMVILRGIPDGGMPGTGHLVAQDVAQLIGYVRSLGRAETESLPGDPKRGEAAYWDWGCEACHVLAGKGVEIGPELTEIGVQRGVAYLRESLIDPGAKVPSDYEFLRARRGDSAAAVEGLLINEDAFSVQLRDANGRFHSFEKASLAGLDRMPKRSIMRSYRGRMSAQEINDLVAFLATRQGEDESTQAGQTDELSSKGKPGEQK